MILLQRGNIDKIVVHLDDPITVSDSIYIFEFINDMTNELISLQLEDISDYKYRYNEFLLDVDDNFTDKKNGFWTYKIYEYKADPYLKRLLQVGKMKLTGDPLDYTEYTSQDEDFIVYN